MTLAKHLIAVQNIKHEIRAAIEAAGVSCNNTPLIKYANKLREVHGYDPAEIVDTPATTLATKLAKIAAAKNYIRQALERRVFVYESTVFRDYPALITEYVIPGIGNNWTAAGKVDQAVKDILIATDGTIYISGASKIWKTTDLLTFTEMTLSGTIDDDFGRLCEISGNRIFIADNTALWLKPAGSDTFTRTSMTNTQAQHSGGQATTGGPGNNLIGLHGTGSIGGQGTIDVYNADTGAKIGWYGITTASLGGYAEEPGVIADNGSFVCVGVNNIGQYIWRRTTGGTASRVVAQAASYLNRRGRIWRDSAGRIFVLRHATETTVTITYSEDHGETWTEEVSCNYGGVVASGANLQSKMAVVGADSSISRTDDNFVSVAGVATLDGNISVIKRLSATSFIAGTSGSTTNLYLLEA